MANSDWFILELSDNIDNPGYCEIKSAIVDIFGETIEYFIPIHHQQMGTYISTSTYIPGYVFIKDCEEARSAATNIKDNRMFNRILIRNGKFNIISSAVVAGLKRRLKNSLKKNFEPGTKVKVCEGALKNLIGEVVTMEDGGLNVVVRIQRLSREIIAPIPATLVEVYTNE